LRDGVIISLGVSFCLHFALVVSGMIKFPEPPRPPEQQMVVLPLEIMKISDSTNVAAASMKIPKAPDPKAMEEAAKAAASAATAPAPAAEAEVMPGTTPTPKPTVSPTATPKKEAQAEKKKDEFNDVLNSVLQSAKTAKPAQRPVTAPGNINNVDSVNRQGMGDNKTNTATFAAYFSSQLKSKCWGDQDDLPDAKRLHALIRVRFNPSGMLNGEPELVEPNRMPASDRTMTIFVTRALRALQQCQPFTIPPEYNQRGQPPIEINFLP
jgi:hypothetical protein